MFWNLEYNCESVCTTVRSSITYCVKYVSVYFILYLLDGFTGYGFTALFTKASVQADQRHATRVFVRPSSKVRALLLMRRFDL